MSWPPAGLSNLMQRQSRFLIVFETLVGLVDQVSVCLSSCGAQPLSFSFPRTGGLPPFVNLDQTSAPIALAALNPFIISSLSALEDESSSRFAPNDLAEGRESQSIRLRCYKAAGNLRRISSARAFKKKRKTGQTDGGGRGPSDKGCLLDVVIT